MDVTVTGKQVRDALDVLGIDTELKAIREIRIGVRDITVIAMPCSHIVVHCSRCGTSWHIDPHDHSPYICGPAMKLMAAVEHDCQEKKE